MKPTWRDRIGAFTVIALIYAAGTLVIVGSALAVREVLK